LPPLESLQRDAEAVVDWIDYSTLDAEATFKLYHFLKDALIASEWHGAKTQWDFYWEFWRPFGELLTDIEREGIMVDLEHLRAMEIKAQEVASSILSCAWLCSDDFVFLGCDNARETLC
jgi:DNA polymerase I